LPIIRIPDRHRPGLIKIRLVREEDFAELVWALENSAVVARFPLLSSRVASQVKLLNKTEIDDILRTLLSLASSLADSEVSVDKVASDLVDAMRASAREDLRLSPENEDVFKNRIVRLLNISSLNMSAKACRVRTDYPGVFCDAKILSDIRPVFDKPGDKPIGSVINHTLRIEYHEEGDHKEFYVALDTEDLSKLKRTLERAETKAASLKAYLKNSNMPDLDLS